MRLLRVIIAGSRGFGQGLMSKGDFEIMTKCLDEVLGKARENGDCIVILSGTARGADRMGEAYAKLRGYECEQYPADWDKYGRSAGYNRNAFMARNATHLITFWDGESRGTMHMQDIMKKMEKPTRTFNFQGELTEIT